MEKILIVEDDDYINQLLVDLLEETYELEQAFSGTEAKRIFKKGKYDLILLDLMLPGLSGQDLIKEIRKDSNVPIIVITAKSEMSVLAEVFKLGANDYIAKPFHNVEVQARIESLLKNTRQNSKKKEEVLEAAGIEMNLQTHTVLFNGHEIDLKLKEFDLLKCFLENPRKVFTKANLYETVWKEPYYGDDNTIAVHISRLRNKLEPYSEDELIKTVWGVGFKLHYK